MPWLNFSHEAPLLPDPPPSLLPKQLHTLSSRPKTEFKEAEATRLRAKSMPGMQPLSCAADCRRGGRTMRDDGSGG